MIKTLHNVEIIGFDRCLPRRPNPASNATFRGSRSPHPIEAEAERNVEVESTWKKVHRGWGSLKSRPRICLWLQLPQLRETGRVYYLGSPGCDDVDRSERRSHRLPFRIRRGLLSNLNKHMSRTLLGLFCALLIWVCVGCGGTADPQGPVSVAISPKSAEITRGSLQYFSES